MEECTFIPIVLRTVVLAHTRVPPPPPHVGDSATGAAQFPLWAQCRHRSQQCLLELPLAIHLNLRLPLCPSRSPQRVVGAANTLYEKRQAYIFQYTRSARHDGVPTATRRDGAVFCVFNSHEWATGRAGSGAQRLCRRSPDGLPLQQLERRVFYHSGY